MSEQTSGSAVTSGAEAAGSTAAGGLFLARKAAGSAGKAAAGAAAAAVSPLLIPLLIAGLLFLIIICTLVGGISSAQLDSTYYLTAAAEDNGMNAPKEEDKEDALFSRQVSIDASNELLAVIAEMKAKDREKQIEIIKETCEANGWDVSESLSRLREEKETAYVDLAGQEGDAVDTVTVETAFSLSAYRKSQLRKFPVIEKDAVRLPSVSIVTDPYGFLKVQNEDGTQDYLASLPGEFGGAGTRHMITFKNGTKATFYNLGAGSSGSGENSLAGAKNGLLGFVIDPEETTAGVLFRRDAAAHPQGIFDEIKSIARITGGKSASYAQGVTAADGRVLAAYSVALSNVELTKVDGFFGGLFAHVGEKYVNEKGLEFDAVWFGERAGKIDYKKDLKKRIEKFLEHDSFYRIDYEREGGAIKVYSRVETVTSTVTDPETGESKTVTTSYTIYWVVPILIEKDINSIAEKLFEIDPAGIYVNDDGTGITNAEVITRFATATQVLLYDIAPGGGRIYVSDAGGIFAWPAPGVKELTSLFGYRIHPISGEYKLHEGLDFACPTGSPLIACADGVITHAGWYGGYGLTVIVAHDNGITTLYGHCGALLAGEGQRVVCGQQIALSGNTGNSTGPHLHLEVRESGVPVDPLKYIQGQTVNSAVIS